jgi:hypothetical protein
VKWCFLTTFEELACQKAICDKFLFEICDILVVQILLRVDPMPLLLLRAQSRDWELFRVLAKMISQVSKLVYTVFLAIAIFV